MSFPECIGTGLLVTVFKFIKLSRQKVRPLKREAKKNALLAEAENRIQARSERNTQVWGYNFCFKVHFLNHKAVYSP